MTAKRVRAPRPAERLLSIKPSDQDGMRRVWTAAFVMSDSFLLDQSRGTILLRRNATISLSPSHCHVSSALAAGDRGKVEQ
jgi:hypothetical protein